MKVSRLVWLIFSLVLASEISHSQTTVAGIVPLATYGGEVYINNPTNWQQVTRTTYSSIQSLFSAIPVASGATRKYYLVLRRADNQPGGPGSYWRFSCSANWNGGTWIPGHGFTLTSNWGNPDEGTTDWIEVPPTAISSCSPAYWEVDSKMVNSGSVMRIDSVSMAAVDVVGGTNISYSQAASGADSTPEMSWLYDTLWATSASGNIGIGTSTPGAKLEIYGGLKLSSGSGGNMTFADGTQQNTAWTGVLCGGDYAEAVETDGSKTAYEPGDVLVISGDNDKDVQKSHEPYSTMVAGIYATKPGVVGKREALSKVSDDIPMAMVGIVPTKVTSENGAIHRGDLLVTSSKAGYAMRGTDRSRLVGAVIGKAMGTLDAGTGTIEVLVTLQ